MTNAEKYLKEKITKEDIEQLAKSIDTFYQNNIELLPVAIQQFFNEIQKPTLTENERVILRNINKEARIWREKGKLWIYCEGNLFNEDIFQFIKERGRI